MSLPVVRPRQSVPDLFGDLFADLRPLSSRLLGFEPFGDMLKSFSNYPTNSFPPYNIEQRDDAYVITMAVAGYTREQLSVKVDDGNTVHISGSQQPESDNTKMLYQGIARRSFEQSFLLGPTVKVVEKTATLKDGILTVVLKLSPSSFEAESIPIEN